MKSRGIALLPFLVFAVFYAGLSLYARVLGLEMPWYRVSMPVAFLVASAVSLCLGEGKAEERVEAYACGMGEPNIMIMCLVFLLAGAFASVAKGAGAVDAAVLISQKLMPANLMVAGVFLVSCVISLAIGTSCGTIAAVMPIALGFSESLRLAPALLTGAVVSGAMFGDNLSFISDTTIAATRTQGVRMRDKFLANVFIALPPAVLAFVAYALSPCEPDATLGASAVEMRHVWLVLPYVAVFVLALVGVNVMALLFFGVLTSAVLGGAFSSLSPFDMLDSCKTGMASMAETMTVALLAGGLFASVRANGGILWLTDRIARCIRGPRVCELGVAALVATVNVFTANNTVAIVIAGPVARECAEKFGASAVRIASVLDTVSCVVQGVIPYGAQILIAIGVAGSVGLSVDFVSLLSCLYYPPLLAVAVFVAMFFRSRTRG